MGRPPGTVIRRAGGTARTTRGCASSLGAGGSFRRARTTTGMSGARCTAMTFNAARRRSSPAAGKRKRARGTARALFIAVDGALVR
jgi:hypothetical protein